MKTNTSNTITTKKGIAIEVEELRNTKKAAIRAEEIDAIAEFIEGRINGCERNIDYYSTDIDEKITDEASETDIAEVVEQSGWEHKCITDEYRKMEILRTLLNDLMKL